jgi:hypothetical protein
MNRPLEKNYSIKIILLITAIIPFVIAFFALRSYCEFLGILTYSSILLLCGYLFFYKWKIKQANFFITLLVIASVFLLYIALLIVFTVFLAINCGIDLCMIQ